jgi:hypothetical protein
VSIASALGRELPVRRQDVSGRVAGSLAVLPPQEDVLFDLPGREAALPADQAAVALAGVLGLLARVEHAPPATTLFLPVADVDALVGGGGPQAVDDAAWSAVLRVGRERGWVRWQVGTIDVLDAGGAVLLLVGPASDPEGDGTLRHPLGAVSPTELWTRVLAAVCALVD